MSADLAPRCCAQSLVEPVLAEIGALLSSIADGQVQALLEAILQANEIGPHGAGRMGLMSSALAMRLAHLGLRSHVLGEATTPGVGPGDLLILSSSSGETQTVYDVASLGKAHGARLALITARPDSRMGRLADLLVVYRAPTKPGVPGGASSIQPMTTVAEQGLLIFFDILVLLLMRATNQTAEDLWRRHRNLE